VRLRLSGPDGACDATAISAFTIGRQLRVCPSAPRATRASCARTSA